MHRSSPARRAREFRTRVVLLILVGVVGFGTCSLGVAPSSAHLVGGVVDCPPLAPGSFMTCRFRESTGATMTFYLFPPVAYQPTRHYPLVLLLEGGAERASASKTPEQNRQVLLGEPYTEVWGPGSSLPGDPMVQQRWPSFVVIPQVEAPARYIRVPAATGSSPLPAQPTVELRMAKEIVDVLQQRYAGIDPHRRYVVGVSMGGYATWEMIERWPDYFAAAGPIAGAGDPTKAARLVQVPIWAFHGAADTIVPVSGSRDMIRAIIAAGGHPRYTEYANGDHAAWVNAFSIARTPTPWLGFYAWLFAQWKAAPSN